MSYGTDRLDGYIARQVDLRQRHGDQQAAGSQGRCETRQYLRELEVVKDADACHGVVVRVRQIRGRHVLDANADVRRDALSRQGDHVWCPVDRVDMTSALSQAGCERAGTAPDVEHLVQMIRQCSQQPPLVPRVVIPMNVYLH